MVKPVRMAKRQWAAAVGALLWGSLLCLGVSLYLGAASQGIEGLPNRGQLILYIGIPAAMVMAGLLLILVGARIPFWVFASAFVAFIAAFLPVLVLFGGGV